jgi:hypothetical protein
MIPPYSGKSQTYSVANNPGTTMKALKRLGLALDLALLAASLTTGGPIADQVKMIAIVVISAIGAMAVFTCTVLAIAAIQSRQPPYEM